MSSKNTIFALATAPGKSGVAVVRISGGQALAALASLSGIAPLPHAAQYTGFKNPASGDVIDKGLALYFKAPRSFTGEDVVELHLHGSPGVIRETLSVLSSIPGLRPAEPGEFTRRAFLNGKMDLVEAEGLADLIDAETAEQKKQALRQMYGKSSSEYLGLREGVIHSLALLEAYIDFPDEDIPENVLAETEANIEKLRISLREMLAGATRGERIRDGLQVVITGAPNVGKSSLMNVIARRDVAIVSHHAGTTRDVIETHLDIGGFPVTLIDTAGLRESGDEVEREGIRRAVDRAANADVKLVMFDGKTWPEKDTASDAQIDDGAIVVVNKSDLIEKKNPDGSTVFISIKTGDGINELLGELEKRVTRFFSSRTPAIVTRERHRALLSEALSHLERFSIKAPLELSCEELRRAALSIGKITGKIVVDDVLDVVFKRFCIGK